MIAVISSVIPTISTMRGRDQAIPPEGTNKEQIDNQPKFPKQPSSRNLNENDMAVLTRELRVYVNKQLSIFNA